MTAAFKFSYILCCRRREGQNVRNWDYDEKGRDWDFPENRRDWDSRNR